MKLLVKKWESYNPRKDVKKSSWFRFEHGMILEADFWGLSDAEFRAWIYILCQCSTHSSGEIEINQDHCERVAAVKFKAVESVARKLKLFQEHPVDVTCTLRERYVDVTRTCSTDVRDGRTDETARTAPAASPKDPVETLVEAMVKIHGDEAWVRAELRKAQAWIITHPGRKLTSRFFAKWLNNATDSKPIVAAPATRKPEMAWDAELQAYVELKDDSNGHT